MEPQACNTILSRQGNGVPYQVAVGLGTSSPMEAKQGFYLGAWDPQAGDQPRLHLQTNKCRKRSLGIMCNKHVETTPMSEQYS